MNINIIRSWLNIAIKNANNIVEKTSCQNIKIQTGHDLAMLLAWHGMYSGEFIFNADIPEYMHRVISKYYGPAKCSDLK